MSSSILWLFPCLSYSNELIRTKKTDKVPFGGLGVEASGFTESIFGFGLDVVGGYLGGGGGGNFDRFVSSISMSDVWSRGGETGLGGSLMVARGCSITGGVNTNRISQWRLWIEQTLS